MSVLLARHYDERPWGVDELPAPFVTPQGKRIGEVWFIPPAALDQLLVKYIFTSAALSVQVHPSNAQARAQGLSSRGKEECWLVIGAEAGARLGIGFNRALDQEAMRAAALDGSIEQLLTWHEVEAGDFFYIPAGTVHAIGPGVRLIEVQQNSDITYRLYDYGRPRELHLDAGIAVARGEPYPPALRQRLSERGEIVLVDGPHFRLARLDGPASADLAARFAGPVLAIPIDCAARVGDLAVQPGQCALAPSLAELAADGLCLIAQPL
ncbi:MAG TPA: class I mannose-6-phosphate isomerase [Novosphingobium sp.]|nr:class I mannose-6-phosphate isomerase [Novosphingobium sp.]